MPSIARETDQSSHGEAALTEFDIAQSIKVNGLSIAIFQGLMQGTTGPCGLYDPPIHIEGGTMPGTAQGSLNVFAEGSPVHRVTDLRGCGAVTATGSLNTFAN